MRGGCCSTGSRTMKSFRVEPPRALPELLQTLPRLCQELPGSLLGWTWVRRRLGWLRGGSELSSTAYSDKIWPAARICKKSCSKHMCFSVESGSGGAGACTGAPRPSPSPQPAHNTKVSLEVASSEVTRIAARSAFLELGTGATGAAGSGEVVARPAARTPHPTRAGG